MCASSCQRNSGCGIVSKAAAVVLILVGVLVLIFSVPSWFWIFLLAALLIVGGILIWRSCG